MQCLAQGIFTEHIQLFVLLLQIIGTTSHNRTTAISEMVLWEYASSMLGR